MLNNNCDILVIGNGFDLCHGLPTSYIDFMDFAIAVEHARVFRIGLGTGNVSFCDWLKNTNLYKSRIGTKFEFGIGRLCAKLDEDLSKSTVDQITIRNETGNNITKEYVDFNDANLNEFYELLEDNLWYIFFKDLLKDQKVVQGKNGKIGAGWIDFEAEIRIAISYLDCSIRSMNIVYDKSMLGGYDVKNKSITIKDEIRFIESIGYFKSVIDSKCTGMMLEEIRNKLYKDLRKMARALEIYLVNYIEKIKLDQIEFIKSLNPKCVISFNYTHTYNSLYNMDGKCKIYYVHGENKENGVLDNNNFVLGIDEYWSEEYKNINTNYVIFKKFMQRILFGTDKNYSNILEQVDRWSKSIDKKYNIHVIGHSLDETDKDILMPFLKNSHANITIWSHNQVNVGNLAANAIRIMGEDEVIKRSSTTECGLRFEVLS